MKRREGGAPARGVIRKVSELVTRRGCIFYLWETNTEAAAGICRRWASDKPCDSQSRHGQIEAVQLEE